MGYKIIDGVAYEVKELDISDLKVEVTQAVNVVTEQNAKIAEITDSKQKTSDQFDTQISNYRDQIANIQALITNLETKKVSTLAPIDAQLAECADKINKAKDALLDKQDIIKALLPEEAQKLGI